MEQIISIVSLIFGFLGTGGVCITTIMFRRANKRIKNTEASTAEFSGLKMQIDFLTQRIDALQQLIISKDVYIGTLTKDKHTLEIKHAKNKGAMNEAYSCKNYVQTNECPVLVKRAIHEEEYLRSIEKA